MKVLNIYSGYANAQTGIGTVLHTLNNNHWNENNIEYDTLSLDDINKKISIDKNKKSIKKLFLSKGRLIWWQLAEKNILFSIFYVQILYLNRAKKLVIENIEKLNNSDVILVNDLWTILVLFEYYPELLSKCCYVNHSDGELAGFIKNIFKPINGSKFFEKINNKLYLALKEIKHLVVLSDIAKIKVLEQYEFIDNDSISVIYNGFKDNNIRNYKSDVHNITLHVAGTLCSRKRQYLLIPIMKHFKEKNITLNIYGVGPDYDKIKNEIIIEGLTNINMRGFVESPYKEYCFGDFFILLSEKEGFPMAAVEAVSVGCPLILTNAGGAKELIEKTAGFLIDETDNSTIVKNVISIINKLLENNDKNLSYKAIDGFKGNFTDVKMLESYIKMVKRIFK